MGFNLNYEESPKRLAPPKNTLYRVLEEAKGESHYKQPTRFTQLLLLLSIESLCHHRTGHTIEHSVWGGTALHLMLVYWNRLGLLSILLVLLLPQTIIWLACLSSLTTYCFEGKRLLSS